MLYFFVVRIKNMGDDEIVGSRSTMRMQLPLKKKKKKKKRWDR